MMMRGRVARTGKQGTLMAGPGFVQSTLEAQDFPESVQGCGEMRGEPEGPAAEAFCLRIIVRALLAEHLAQVGQGEDVVGLGVDDDT
jgi:hypothetical protein